jgi:HD-GYP domain-containing protein (c-di-GMP phosphodiesterase class II)
MVTPTDQAISELINVAQHVPSLPSGRVLSVMQLVQGKLDALDAMQVISERLANMTADDDLQGILEEVLHRALERVNGERGVLALLEDGVVRILASRQGESIEAVQPSTSLLERVVSSGQAIVTTNAQDDPSMAAASILLLDIRSVLAVPLRAREQVIGALYVDTQITERVFTTEDAGLLETFASQAGTAVLLTRSLYNERERNRLEREQAISEREHHRNLIRTMLTTLDARDPYTAGHSDRVGEYTRLLARELEWNESEEERARFAGWVHDIGKIGIQDRYLLKPGPLTPEERKILEQHSVIGERILSSANDSDGLLPAVRHHHERWDGNGYPDKIAGEKIPLLARMIGITDAFDAMTTTRLYAKRRTWLTAFSILREEAGKQFDPNLVPIFIRAVEGLEPGMEADALNAPGVEVETPVVEVSV